MRLVTVYDNAQSLVDRLLGIDHLDSNDLFHLYDVFDDTLVERMVKEKGKPGVFVNDAFLYYEGIPKETTYIGLPLWMEQEAKKFTIDEFTDTLVTNRCFNFMINKKLINRYLLLKLVEIFNLSSMIYTWSGLGPEENLTKIIEELDRLGDKSPLTVEQRAQLFESVKLIPHFIENPPRPSIIENPVDAVSTVNNSHVPYYGNKTTWQAGLNIVFSTSAVSLISESVDYQRGAAYTEKSLFSVFGLNFPLWIGGYKQAEYWEKIGFDVFHDVIDHSYQYYDTLIERCYWAFAKNIRILQDLEFATAQRIKCRDRLLHNRQISLNGIFDNYTDKIMSLHSQEIRDTFEPVAEIYRQRGRGSKILNNAKVI